MLKSKCIHETNLFEVNNVFVSLNHQELNALNKEVVVGLEQNKYFENIVGDLVVLNETTRLWLNEQVRSVLNNSVVASMDKSQLVVLNYLLIAALNGTQVIELNEQQPARIHLNPNVGFVLHEIVHSSLNETLFATLNRTILNVTHNKVVDALLARQSVLKQETDSGILSRIEHVQAELNTKVVDTLYNKVLVAIENKVLAHLNNKTEIFVTVHANLRTEGVDKISQA